jgi:hypothetical protein
MCSMNVLMHVLNACANACTPCMYSNTMHVLHLHIESSNESLSLARKIGVVLLQAC